jgi:uncharacterized Zn ribbon protein
MVAKQGTAVRNIRLDHEMNILKEKLMVRLLLYVKIT